MLLYVPDDHQKFQSPGTRGRWSEIDLKFRVKTLGNGILGPWECELKICFLEQFWSYRLKILHAAIFLPFVTFLFYNLTPKNVSFMVLFLLKFLARVRDLGVNLTEFV